MGKVAFLFAGQGSQYAGMGKDFFENIPEVHDFFGVAEAIRPGTLTQMFGGSEDELKRTENTQPCMFLADIAGAMALEKSGIKPDAVAGFSLGEVVAMAVSGALKNEQAYKLVCKRGKVMQEAADTHKGQMVAVLGMDKDKLRDICSANHVYPVNYNCPGQVVVSGAVDNMEKFKTQLKDLNERFMELKVGGPFHSPYMSEAAKAMEKELTETNVYNLKKADIALFANKTAKPYPEEKEEMIKTFSGQMESSVRWEETLLNMADDGVDTFIECGPGRTLSGFVKRTVPGARIFNVCDMESLKKVVEELG